MTVLTVIGATVRIVGSDRSLWIDEISTMAWHIRGPAIDTSSSAESNNHLLNSLLSCAAVMLFREHEWDAAARDHFRDAINSAAVFWGKTLLRPNRGQPRDPGAYSLLSSRVPLARCPWLQRHVVWRLRHIRAAPGVGAAIRLVWAVYCIGMFICVGSVVIGTVVLAGQLITVGIYRAEFAVLCSVRAHFLAAAAFLFFRDSRRLGFIFGDYAHTDTSWHSSNALQDAVVRGLRLDTIVVPLSCVVELCRD